MFSIFTKKPPVQQERTLIKRSFEPSLFISKEDQELFNKQGFVHLKNVLTQSEIQSLISLYHTSKDMNGFQNTDYYINSIGFEDKNIRTFLKENTERILQPILPRFVNTDHADFPLSGGFCINPPHAIRGCSPHQDPTCVDEIQSYSMTIWITLNDMTTENGCMHIIPGSHLWGNLYRSVCVPWAFEKNTALLWKFLLPIPTKAGDVICFDVSTIHASTPNNTDNTRLAMTVQTIPKNLDLISYYPVNKDKVAVYSIDRDYFIQESQYKKPSGKYKVTHNVTLNNFFTEKNIEALNESYTHQLNNSIV